MFLRRIVLGIIVLTGICLLFIYPITTVMTKRDVTATVTNAERVCTGGETIQCKYLIFTDVTTYENRDELLFWKWNSSDLYGKLAAGKQYRLTITGFRFSLLSFYPNIISAEAVS